MFNWVTVENNCIGEITIKKLKKKEVGTKLVLLLLKNFSSKVQIAHIFGTWKPLNLETYISN